MGQRGQEEALHKFTELNKLIRDDEQWWLKDKNNILGAIGQRDGMLTEILEELENSANQTINATDKIELDLVHENVMVRTPKTTMTDYYNLNVSNNLNVVSGDLVSGRTKEKQLEDMKDCLMKQAEREKSFGTKLQNTAHASVLWGRKFDLEQEKNSGLWSIDEKDYIRTKFESDPVPELQNFSEKPILLGADVVSLYPNLKKEVTGEMIYRAVMECDIDFQGLDYEMMSIYLFLVLGAGCMIKCGLGDCIPIRKGKSNARSLIAKTNRDQNEWQTRQHKFTEDLKRKMFGRLLQIITIVLMSSSCYTFAGEIYRQKTGAGIGERGSACVAKTVMSLWDKLWACCQYKSSLFCPLFIRYVDDIRIYLHPINEGWTWNGSEWSYSPDRKDDYTYEQGIKIHILETLNGILESVTLTIERKSDFTTGMLPTLDFQTRVRQDWEVEFLYYAKPMSSGLVIQCGTALSKQTVFSSLRQDLIRRLMNTSEHFNIGSQIDIIEVFTQSLSNSGHSYVFSKSIILQALTRFKSLKLRSRLEQEDPRYLPLYRDKRYNWEKRCKVKKTLGKTWFTGISFGDKFKQE